MRTLIKGGTIVNADATTPADVLVDGERIALIGEALEVEADRTVDATGRWVIPGGRMPSCLARTAIREATFIAPKPGMAPIRRWRSRPSEASVQIRAESPS